MLNIFNFMPPVACYGLAGATVVVTYFAQIAVTESTGAADSRVYVVGGILAFLIAFLGFQRTLEQRDEARRPRVSSHDVLQKLAPSETGLADPDLNQPPKGLLGPEADSPLGRIRSRSSQIGTWVAEPETAPGKG